MFAILQLGHCDVMQLLAYHKKKSVMQKDVMKIVMALSTKVAIASTGLLVLAMTPTKKGAP
jgi:hypothetical protein